MATVNAIVAGTVDAPFAPVAGGSTPVVGPLVDAVYLLGMLEIAGRPIGAGPKDIRFPVPADVSVEG